MKGETQRFLHFFPLSMTGASCHPPESQLCHVASLLPQPVKPEMAVSLELPRAPASVLYQAEPLADSAGNAPGLCPVHLLIDNHVSACASGQSPLV